MAIFSLIKTILGFNRRDNGGDSSVPYYDRPGAIFIGVRIPESIYPHDREDKYGEPLDKALQAAGVGAVTGGGTQMGEDNSIEFVDLEVVIIDRERGFEIIRQTMRDCRAPPGTIIEDYSTDDEVRKYPI